VVALAAFQGTPGRGPDRSSGEESGGAAPAVRHGLEGLEVGLVAAGLLPLLTELGSEPDGRGGDRQVGLRLDIVERDPVFNAAVNSEKCDYYFLFLGKEVQKPILRSLHMCRMYVRRAFIFLRNYPSFCVLKRKAH
jgi:hypothetical protein